MIRGNECPYSALSLTPCCRAACSSAAARTRNRCTTIDQRQDYQQDRIEHGIRDGQITSSEARRLEQGERAIDRAQARARADGVVTQQERARIDRMTDREGREIYRQSHDRQQAWDRGQSWGHTDGRYDGWRDNGGRQDGWGRGGDRDGDRGQHNGWARGEHNGWDGNRPPGIERRDARQDQRIQNGARDGSLTHGEANRLERGQDRINRYEARARSDGVVDTGRAQPHRRHAEPRKPPDLRRSPQRSHRNGHACDHADRQRFAQLGQWRLAAWIAGWQHDPTTPTTGTPPAGGSRNGGNGGWQHAPQAGNTPPATPSTGGSRSWGNGNGGYRMQQAAATPQQQAQAPRPTMTRVSSPAPSAGGRSSGGRR